MAPFSLQTFSPAVGPVIYPATLNSFLHNPHPQPQRACTAPFRQVSGPKEATGENTCRDERVTGYVQARWRELHVSEFQLLIKCYIKFSGSQTDLKALYEKFCSRSQRRGYKTYGSPHVLAAVASRATRFTQMSRESKSRRRSIWLLRCIPTGPASTLYCGGATPL